MAIIKIDPEFQALIEPLQPEEYRLLEENIKRDGCQDPLRVWEGGGDLLLDGHNRYAICQKWSKGYGVTYLELPDRNAALLWIAENQLGRRNVTDDQRAMLIKAIERLRAKTPEAKAIQTAAARKAKSDGKSVDSKTLSTEKKFANAELAKKHKVPQRKLPDAGTVLAAAEKPNAPQAIKDLPAKVRRGEMKVSEARKIVKAASPAPAARQHATRRLSDKAFNGRIGCLFQMICGSVNALDSVPELATRDLSITPEDAERYIAGALAFDKYLKQIVSNLRRTHPAVALSVEREIAATIN